MDENDDCDWFKVVFIFFFYQDRKWVIQRIENKNSISKCSSQMPSCSKGGPNVRVQSGDFAVKPNEA